MSTFTQIYYHIVFSTKNREPVLRPERRDELFRYIWGIIRNKQSHLYRNTSNNCRCLFDLFRVESIGTSVTPGCTRGYSHSCPSGTVRDAGGLQTRERNLQPEREHKPPNLLGTSDFDIRIS